YRLNSGTGALTPTARGKVRARQGPMGIGFLGGSLPVTYTPKFVYVVSSNDDTALRYTIDATIGALTLIAASPLDYPYPGSVALDPRGKFAYVASEGTGGPHGALSGYTITPATGALTRIPGSPFDGEPGPFCVAVDPSGRFVYVANTVGVFDGG